MIKQITNNYNKSIIKYINNNNNCSYNCNNRTIQFHNIIITNSFINNINNTSNPINQKYFTSGNSNEKYDHPHPTEIKLTEKGQRLEIKFDDIKESKYSFSAEFLRIETPSVEKGKSIVSGKRNVKIVKIERVGNYAIRLVYSDLHETGIYSWDYLLKLGKTKYSRMKKYLNDIKTYSRSRDPPTTTQSKQQLIEKILKDTKEKKLN